MEPYGSKTFKTLLLLQLQFFFSQTFFYIPCNSPKKRAYMNFEISNLFNQVYKKKIGIFLNMANVFANISCIPVCDAIMPAYISIRCIPACVRYDGQSRPTRHHVVHHTETDPGPKAEMTGFQVHIIVPLVQRVISNKER